MRILSTPFALFGLRPYEIGIAAFSGLATVYLVAECISFQETNGVDFRVIWIAGKLWLSGQDPYGPAFLKEYATLGPGPDALWLYPPYWFPIAALFSLLPISAATALWKWTNFALLVVATNLIARSMAAISGRRFAPIFLGGIGFVCSMQATIASLYLGQTSILVYFGVAATVFGVLKARASLLAVGLVALALKPQVGVVAFATIAALPGCWWALLVAGGICALATLPLAVMGNYLIMLGSFSKNLQLHSTLRPNHPANMTGLMNILDFSFPTISINSTIFVLTAATCTFVLCRWACLQQPGTSIQRIAGIVLIISAAAFLLPLHSYDLVALAALLMAVIAVPLPGRWLVVAGLLMIFRSRNFYEVSGIANPVAAMFPESLLVSMALLIVLCGAAWAFLRLKPITEPSMPAYDLPNRSHRFSLK